MIRKKKLKKEIKKPLLKAETEPIKKTKIRVIGIGGGGSSIVSEIASRVKKASFVVANTDRQALKEASRKAIRFQFGQSFTQGLGTGMNAELGEIAAQQEKEKIKKLLEGQDLCLIVACLGGGAGSGAAPVFAKISKNLGNLTYGIFTLPFKFEGEKKMEIAKRTLEKIRPSLNALSIIPNERIFQIIDKATPLKTALSAINKNLAESLEGLIETIYQPGLINIDFADLKTILEGQGRLAYLNTVAVPRKEGSFQEVIEKVLNSPLYPYPIQGAKGVLLNIAGEKELGLAEVSQISKTISELLNKEAKIIFGISHKKKYSNLIKTTLLATGCGLKVFAGKAKKKRRRRLQPSHHPARKEHKSLRPTIQPLTHPPALKTISEPSPVKKQPREPKQKLETKKIKKLKKPKLKKVKIKVQKEPEEKITPQSEAEDYNPPTTQGALREGGGRVGVPAKSEVPEKVRKNALQIKKEAEEEEKEMLEKEKFWETPAFLRRKFKAE